MRAPRPVTALSRSLLFAVIASFSLVATGCPSGAGSAPDAAKSPDSFLTDRPATTLAMSYRPGTTYRTTMTMEQSMRMTIGVKEVEQDSVIEADVTLAVEGEAEGAKQITMKYERMKFDMTMGEQTMQFDSAAEPLDPEADDAEPSMSAMMQEMFDTALRPLLNSPIVIDLDAENEITRVRGLDEMRQKLSTNPMMAQLTDLMFSEDQLSQLISKSMVESMPKEPVAPGDSWPVELSMSAGPIGEVQVAGNYTLLGYQTYEGHECAVIDIDSKFSMDMDGADLDDETSAAFAAMGMSMDDGSQSGRMFFDVDLGWARFMDLEQSMTMSMNNPVDGTRQTMPLQQRIKISVAVD